MSKEAMKLALEALQKIYIAPEHEEYIRVWWPACEQAITALRDALASEALDKKAENARELGLDYEPAQQEPLQNNPFDCGVYLGSGKDYAIKHHVSYEPAQQEPVAWTNWRELVGARHYRTPGWEMYADKRNPDDVAIYTSPPAQRTWVGLTDEEANKIYKDGSTFGEMMRMVEAKLKEKNT